MHKLSEQRRAAVARVAAAVRPLSPHRSSVIAAAAAVAAAEVAASITNMTRLYEVALCLSF